MSGISATEQSFQLAAKSLQVPEGEAHGAAAEMDRLGLGLFDAIVLFCRQLFVHTQEARSMLVGNSSWVGGRALCLRRRTTMGELVPFDMPRDCCRGYVVVVCQRWNPRSNEWACGLQFRPDSELPVLTKLQRPAGHPQTSMI